MLWFSSYVIVFEFSSRKVKEKKKNRRHYLLTDPRTIIQNIKKNNFKGKILRLVVSHSTSGREKKKTGQKKYFFVNLILFVCK